MLVSHTTQKAATKLILPPNNPSQTAENESVRRSVCLNMIVKDEARVIRRCLESVKGMIDFWVIVDTGSTDGTQEIIRNTLAGIPGELHERPWVDFGANRTEAIALAQHKADYLFFIDADEELVLPPGFTLPALTEDCYFLTMRFGGVEYARASFAATRRHWRFEGVLHEYLESDGPYSRGTLNELYVVAYPDGGRSQGITVAQKYAKDAAVLEAALDKDPTNTRNAFYLAQSYRDAEMPEKSLAAYERRILLGGWDEEVWYSKYQVAQLSEKLGYAPEAVSSRYLGAYQFRPTRAEPLVAIAAFHRLRQEYALAHLYASRAVETPKPGDILFVDLATYEWRAKDEYSVACYYLGFFLESKNACEEILGANNLPESERDRVKKNLEYAVDALASKG